MCRLPATAGRRAGGILRGADDRPHSMIRSAKNADRTHTHSLNWIFWATSDRFGNATSTGMIRSAAKTGRDTDAASASSPEPVNWKFATHCWSWTQIGQSSPLQSWSASCVMYIAERVWNPSNKATPAAAKSRRVRWRIRPNSPNPIIYTIVLTPVRPWRPRC